MKKLVFLLAIVLVSCAMHQKGEDGKDGTPGKSNNHYKVLNEGAYGGRETASRVVITSQEELNDLYRELNFKNIPNVDFNEYNVVALFLGQKSTGGYSIGIESVGFKEDTATVRIKTTKPKPGENVTMALTQPFCIATITKTGEIIFE